MKLIKEISTLAWEIMTGVNSMTSPYTRKTKPEITVKNVRQGRYSWKCNRITIPQWAVENGERYLIYYVVHELTHVFFHGHDSCFKKAEAETLDYFGIDITYKKAYPKTLSYNGDVFYQAPTRHREPKSITARKWYMCEHCRIDISPGSSYIGYTGKKYCCLCCMENYSKQIPKKT